MNDVCQTSITPEMYAQLPSCEAVAVRYYRRPDGSEFAKVIACGTEAEMEDLVSTPSLLLQLGGIETLGDSVVPVSELLPPDEATEREPDPLSSAGGGMTWTPKDCSLLTAAAVDDEEVTL
jgi:hypothetical protein